MDKKKAFVKCMEYGKYLAFTLATIFVIVSQFVGGRLWIVLALALYTVAFGFLFATLVIRAVELFNAGYEAKDISADVATPDDVESQTIIANEGKLEGEEVEVVNLKSEKVWTIIGAIFFGLFTVFTLVVSILY